MLKPCADTSTRSRRNGTTRRVLPLRTQAHGIFALFGGAFRTPGIGKGARTVSSDNSPALLERARRQQLMACESQLEFFESVRHTGVTYSLLLSTSSTPFDGLLIRALNGSARLVAARILPADHRIASYPLIEHLRWCLEQATTNNAIVAPTFVLLMRIDLVLKDGMYAAFNASWNRLTFPFVSESGCAAAAIHGRKRADDNTTHGPSYAVTTADVMVFVPRRLFGTMVATLPQSFSSGSGHLAWASLTLAPGCARCASTVA